MTDRAGQGFAAPMPLLLLLVAVPIIEVALFVVVGGWLGLWPTLALVLLTAGGGLALLRSQGLAALGRLRAAFARGGDPLDPIAHGALILLAGLLLLTPGFFTDSVGLLLCVPAIRSALIARLGPLLAARAVAIRPQPEVIDGEWRDWPGPPEGPGAAPDTGRLPRNPQP